MSIKKNCWEVKQCGCQAGEHNLDALGVCPAMEASECDGVNGGKNGGRFCWTVTGTLCDGKKQPVFALKIQDCLLCDFFNQVAEEEETDFILHM